MEDLGHLTSLRSSVGDERADAIKSADSSEEEGLRRRRINRRFLLGMAVFCSLAVACVGSLVPRDAFYPFVLPKALIGALLLDTAMLLALAQVLLHPPRRFHVSRSAGLFLFTVVLACLSVVFAFDPYRAWWGSGERADGLILRLGLWTLFPLAMALSSNERVRHWLVRSVVLGAIPTFLYAIGQEHGASWTHEGIDRYSSSFGNPAFYACYLMLVVWLALFQSTVERRSGWQILCRGVAGVAVLFIFLAHSRGALVALFVSGTLFLILTSRAGQFERERRLAILGVVGITLAIGAGFVLRDTSLVRSIPGMGRLTQIGPKDPTTRLRLLATRIAFEAFKERPVIGWGLNNFVYVYNARFDPATLTVDPRFLDKAHNSYANLLAEQGLAGFLAFVAFVGTLISILRPWRCLADRMLLCGLIGYSIQNAFLFDTPASEVHTILLFALIAARDPHGWDVSPVSQRLVRAMAAILLMLVVSHMIIVGRALKESPQAAQLAYGFARGTMDEPRTRQALGRFLDRNSFMEREVLAELSRTSLARIPNDGEGTSLERDLLAAVRHNFDARPNDYQVGIHLLRLSSAVGVRDTACRSLFTAYLPHVIALAPSRPEAYLLAGTHNFRLGNVDEGRRYYEWAARLNRDLAFPYWALGRELVQAGRPNEAKPSVEKALHLGFDYRSPGGLTTLIRVYHGVGDSVRASQYVSIARQSFPGVLDSSITP